MRFFYSSVAFFGIALLLSSAAFAQSVQDWTYYDMTNWDSSPYKAYRFTASNGQAMNFRLLYPKNYDPATGKEYPMIVMLHGYGEAGRRNTREFYPSDDPRFDNNDYQLLHGGREHLNAVNQGKFDGFVLFPQNDYGSWISGKGEVSGSIQRDMAKMIELVEYLPSLHQIDLNRIYVHGLSNGAGGSWFATYIRPDLFAATAPMSHAGDPAMASTLAFNPVWLFQGGQDTNPRPVFAEEMITALKNGGAEPRYTLYPNTGHGTWYQAYAEPEFFSWLSAQNKLNIWVKFGREAFCADEGFSATLGISPGFDGYQWQRNGTTISGANSNSISINEFGEYQVRVQRNGNWSAWGPVKSITEQAPTAAPVITAGLQSTALPDINGKTTVQLSAEGSYDRYRWSNGSTDANITVSSAGAYTLEAADAAGCFSSSSNSIVVTTSNGANAPQAPSNLEVASAQTTSISLKWNDNATNELQYELWRSTTSGSNYSLLAKLAANTTTYTDESLPPSTTYYYQLRAINNDGASASSNQVTAKTTADTQAPTAPENLRITSTNRSSVNLAWNAASDDVEVQDYLIYQDGTQIGTATTTNYSVGGLAGQTQYTFSVRARDAAGNLSVYSNQVAGATVIDGLRYEYYEVEGMGVVPNFALLTPVTVGKVDNFTLDVKERNNDFALRFDGYIIVPTAGTYTFYTSSDDGSKLYIGGEASGNLVVDNDGLHGKRERSGTVDLNAGANRIIVTFFEASGGEALEVRYEGPGISKQLIPASALKDDYTPPAPPAAPTDLTAQASSPYQVELNWTDASNNESGFELYRSLTSTGPYSIITTTDADVSSYADTGLEPNTTYFYKLRAIGQGGASAYAGGGGGLDYDYYEISNMSVVPDFGSYTAVKSGNVPNITLNPRNRNDDFAFRFTGKINIDEAGDYTFFTTSDDGSTLKINGNLVVDNDGLHGPGEASGNLNLQAGVHDIEVGFFEKGGGELLEVRYQGPNVNKQLIPDQAFAVATKATTPPVNSDPPAQPTGLQLTVTGTTSLDLSWTDNADNETAYLIKRATTSGGPYAVIDSVNTDVTSYQDDNLSPHTFYEYKIVASNAGLLSDPSPAVGATTDNSNPELQAIGDLQMNAGANLEKELIATDADGDVLTFSSPDLPAFASITTTGDSLASLSISPAAEDEGIYTFTIKVADDFGGEDEETLTLTVDPEPVNQAPVIAALNDMSVQEGSSDAQAVSAIDTEGDTITLSLQGTVPSFVSLTDNGDGSGSIEVNPLAGDEGNYTITLRADDGNSYSESSFALEVSPEPVNQAPVIAALNDMSVQEGSSDAQAVSASDNEGDTITLSLQGTVPSFISLTDNGDGSGNIEVNPLAGDAGNYTITLRADDGNSYSESSFALEVSPEPVNQAPVIAALNDMSVQEGSSDAQAVSATDNEGDTITLSLQGTVPSFVSLTDNGDGSGSIEINPLAGDAGNYTITLRADDGNSYSESSFALEVSPQPVNQAPVIASISNMTVVVDGTESQNISASDPENDPVSFSMATGTPAFVSLTDNGDGTAIIQLTPVSGDEGSYTLTVEASDSTNLSTADFEVTVNAAPSGTDEVIYRVNVGSDEITDSPVSWERDDRSQPSAYFDPSSSNNTAGASAFFNENNTSAPDQVLTHMRFDYSWGGNLQYHFPVDNGDYAVKLFFAESPYSYGASAVGERIFDVYLENQLALDDLDVYAEAGKNGLEKTLNINVSDGELDIAFERQVNNPFLNGIEIIKRASSTSATASYKQQTAASSASFTASSYPTRFNADIKVEVKSKLNQHVSIQLTDMMGKTYYLKQKDAPKGNSSHQLLLHEQNLPAGMYLIKVQSEENGDLQILKVIKQ